MYFDSLQAVAQMDGHGAFVWSAYGITAVVLGLLIIVPLRRQRALARRIQGELRRARRQQQQAGHAS